MGPRRVPDHMHGEVVRFHDKGVAAMVQCGFDSQTIIASIQAVESVALCTIKHLETHTGIGCDCHKGGQVEVVRSEVEKLKVPYCLAAAGSQPTVAACRFVGSALRGPMA